MAYATITSRLQGNVLMLTCIRQSEVLLFFKIHDWMKHYWILIWCFQFRFLFWQTWLHSKLTLLIFGPFHTWKSAPRSEPKFMFLLHCIHLIRLVRVSHCNYASALKIFTWHTYVLSSSPTLPASPYTWHWLVCKLVCFWSQRVNTAGSLEKRTCEKIIYKYVSLPP